MQVSDPPVAGFSPVRVGRTEVVHQLTGRHSLNATAARWDIHGTDLGHMFKHRGNLYMVFGDTFGAFGFGGRNWRSNTMARIADPNPRNGLEFQGMITGPDGKAKELIPSRKVGGIEKTVIPTYGISIDGRIYLHYMSVRMWQQHGRWSVGHSGLAYSDDDGETWVKPADAVWPAGTGFEQVAFVRDDSVLYSFGIPEGRFGGVRLRRVATGRILEPKAYEYWNGQDWVADAAAAVMIVPAPAGELSVAWSEAHNSWLMMYLDSERHAVVLRTAPELIGPWSEAQVVVTAEEYPGLYAPYIVPGGLIENELYYTMSLWDPYNVSLMRTTLERAEPVIVSAEPAAKDRATASSAAAPIVTRD